jgi:inorganic triphosphatase YgiF
MAEVELKFEVPPEAEPAIRAHPDLAAIRPVEQHLLALYFDTPDEEIARGAMALRLRRSGRGWTQCLKAGASGSGGLHAREEWEFPQTGPTLDLALFSDTPLALLPDGGHLHERLAEAFRVDMRRTTWEIEVAPGKRVEVALDRGEVRREGASEPVSEIEIESVEGEPLAVFEMAERLIDTLPMRPSTVTKARRGYRLLRGEAPAPVRAKAARLDPGASALEAARAALAQALDQLQANEDGALAAADPEYLHQMRSALRRIRSALRVFRKAMGRDLENALRDDIRWLADVMGETRDWDVLATETLPALLHALGDSAEGGALVGKVAKQRDTAHATLREALNSPRHARFVLALARWLAQSRGSAAAEVTGLAQSRGSAAAEVIGLRRLAARVLRKRHRRFAHALAGLSHHEAAPRHRIRVEAKRLRYAVDALDSLYPADGVKAFVRPLGKVQHALGAANDAAVAGRLIASLDPAPGVARFAREWLDARCLAAVEEFERHVAKLEAAVPFWRTH